MAHNLADMTNHARWAGLKRGERRIAVVDSTIPIINQRHNVPIGEYVVSANSSGGGMATETLYLLDIKTAERYAIQASDLRIAKHYGHIREVGD